MHVEVDQSGKVEQTNTDTVLAFSDDVVYAIRISAKVKREAIRWLRASGKQGGQLYMLLFAAALYQLLKDHLDRMQRVIIDIGYQGHERDIKLLLLNLLWRDHPAYPAYSITFAHIGKKSSAHQEALAVYRGDTGADKVVTTKELIGPLMGKK